MRITKFEDIESWQMAKELTKIIYRIVKAHQFSKDYSLRDQVCRASVSVMSNIAEGFNSGSSAEFARFMSYAQRSCAELQAHLYVAHDQNYITDETFNDIYELIDKTGAKIGAFIKYLKQQRTKNHKPRTKNEEQ